MFVSSDLLNIVLAEGQSSVKLCAHIFFKTDFRNKTAGRDRRAVCCCDIFCGKQSETNIFVLSVTADTEQFIIFHCLRKPYHYSLIFIFKLYIHSISHLKFLSCIDKLCIFRLAVHHISKRSFYLSDFISAKIQRLSFPIAVFIGHYLRYNIACLCVNCSVCCNNILCGCYLKYRSTKSTFRKHRLVCGLTAFHDFAVLVNGYGASHSGNTCKCIARFVNRYLSFLRIVSYVNIKLGV